MRKYSFFPIYFGLKAPQFIVVRGFLFFLFLLLFEQNCFALQSIVIGDNQTKKVSISLNELSRIFVKGDRIQNVRGIEGAYTLTKDALLGQIFIKPTSLYQNKPFNLFISTEQGRNYNLSIISAGIPGQDIELKPNTPGKEAILWEKNSDYSQTLVKLIASMINDETPAGYSLVYSDSEEKKGKNKEAKGTKKVKKTKKVQEIKYDNFIITLQKQYCGDHLCGEVFIVKNICNCPINLTEAMFYQEGTRAITILNPTIFVKGQTMLFRVISNDNYDKNDKME